MRIIATLLAMLAIAAPLQADEIVRYLKRAQFTFNSTSGLVTPLLMDTYVHPTASIGGVLVVSPISGPMREYAMDIYVDTGIAQTGTCRIRLRTVAIVDDYTPNGALYFTTTMNMDANGNPINDPFRSFVAFLRRAPDNVYDPVTMVQIPLTIQCQNGVYSTIAMLDFRQNP